MNVVDGMSLMLSCGMRSMHITEHDSGFPHIARFNCSLCFNCSLACTRQALAPVLAAALSHQDWAHFDACLSRFLWYPEAVTKVSCDLFLIVITFLFVDLPLIAQPLLCDEEHSLV